MGKIRDVLRPSAAGMQTRDRRQPRGERDSCQGWHRAGAARGPHLAAAGRPDSGGEGSLAAAGVLPVWSSPHAYATPPPPPGLEVVLGGELPVLLQPKVAVGAEDATAHARTRATTGFREGTSGTPAMDAGRRASNSNSI
jgi:hypothetical protein